MHKVGPHVGRSQRQNPKDIPMRKKERPLILAHLGLDLAKDKFDAAVLTQGGALHHQSFERTAGGLAALRRWLARSRCK